MARRAIAVDLGGTNLRVAVLADDGRLSHRAAVPTRAADGPEVVVSQIVEQVERVAAAAGLADACPVGIALPGPVDPAAEVVAYMPNLAGWAAFRVGDALRAAGSRPFVLGNDGNCGALGEARFGARGGVDHLVYLALGTGVGGGIVAGGRLVTGARGFGGEVGHVPVAIDGPTCTCGAIGCLEAYVSGWALTRDAGMVAETADGARLRELAGDGPVTPNFLVAAAAAGDPAALALLERAGRALGAAIGGFVNLFNPDAVVVGGGVGMLGEPLLGPARRALAGHAFALCRDGLRVESSSLGADTALYGAGALALGQRP
jgi:glucokinase